MARGLLALICVSTCSCADEPSPDAGARTDAGRDAGDPDVTFVAVTFNSGTTEGLPHDSLPDDGYTSAHSVTSDTHYGDGLAWIPAVDAARAFFAELDPDVVAFQEIFHSDECATIPTEAHADFVCETWSPGDLTVANVILGMGFQVVCNLGKPDKCAAVNRRFGTFRGCDADLCLDGLDGARVPDCGSGSRIGRGVIDLAAGGSITLVTVHGSSGAVASDQACRVAQFEQVFVDLDGEPAANGDVNLVLGDLNVDPARFAPGDPSAVRWNDFVGDGRRFHFITDVGRRAEPTYAEFVNIDHVVSDTLEGECWAAGITAGHPSVIEAIYFDHVPIVCAIAGDLP